MVDVVPAPVADTAVAPTVVAPVVPVVPPAPIALAVAPVVSPVIAPVAPVAPVLGAVVEYEPTGDAGLDVALSFVGKLGIAVDHPAMAATANGDFSLIKAHLATMGDKAIGWEQMVALAEASHTRNTAAATEKAAKVTAAVHGIAGTAEHWGTVQTWASAQATLAEKAELNAMFDAGPVQARAAAQMLVDLYAKSPGAVVKPASAVTSPTAGGAPTTAGPLSVREYSAAVQALANKIGSSNLNNSPEYAALGKRLAARA